VGPRAQPTRPPAGAGTPAGLADPTGLGKLDQSCLAVALRPLFEDAGPLVEELAGRSFPTWEAVLDAAEAAIATMCSPARAALLRAHPRIGTDPATLARRSPESWAEQGGDLTTPPELLARLAQLNDLYEQRFGFPFVEWVAGRPRETLVAVLEERLGHDRPEELSKGCAALVDIARDRLARLGRRASSTPPGPPGHSTDLDGGPTLDPPCPSCS